MKKSNIEKVKDLYDQIEDKKSFHIAVAEHFELRTSSVRTNWFTRFEIPETYGVIKRLIEFTENYIANIQQIEKTA